MSAEVIDMARARHFRPAVVALQYARAVFDIALLNCRLGRITPDVVLEKAAELKATAGAAQIAIEAWEKRRAA